MVKPYFFGQMWAKTFKIRKTDGFIEYFLKERDLLTFFQMPAVTENGLAEVLPSGLI